MKSTADTIGSIIGTTPGTDISPASNAALTEAATRLRNIWQQLGTSDNELNAEVQRIVAAREEVVPRFQKLFAVDRIDELTAEEMHSFLPFKSNQHWIGLQRLGPFITKDMKRLREALTILFDEQRPIETRLNKLVPTSGPAYVPRLSRAVLTPLLMIQFPEKYGVLNQVSKAALEELGVWPTAGKSMPFGNKYVLVNEVLVHLATEVGVDLWTLDSLLWRVLKSDVADDGPAVVGNELETLEHLTPVGESDVVQRFVLEKHLHEFLCDNWAHTLLGKDWEIFEEDGEEAGIEYACAVGRIDILARHRTEPEWLVVELKRGQSNDSTLGQVLRYMGWVRSELAADGEEVLGAIIAPAADDKLKYAIGEVPNVQLYLYEVEFQLTKS